MITLKKYQPKHMDKETDKSTDKQKSERISSIQTIVNPLFFHEAEFNNSLKKILINFCVFFHSKEINELLISTRNRWQSE